MWQVLMAFAVFGMMVVAFKVALIFLIAAGLIFRTKETIALLVVCGVLSAFQVHPWITTGVAGGLMALGYYFKRKEGQEISDRNSLPAPDG